MIVALIDDVRALVQKALTERAKQILFYNVGGETLWL